MNPLLGRWISADPLTVHQPHRADLNLYAYVSGRALKSVDPLGLETPEQLMEPQAFQNIQAALGNGSPPPSRATAQPASIGSQGTVADDPMAATGGYEGGSGLPDTGAAGASSEGATAAANAISSVAPGGGELADMAVLADPDATELEKGMAVVSLAVSLVSGGLLPNYGAVRGAAGLVDVSRSSSGAGHGYAREIIEGGTGKAFAGHGELRYGSGETVVPQGTTITFPAGPGQAIDDGPGRMMERGAYGGAEYKEGAASFLPGATIPNYTLKAPTDLTIMSESMTVDQATPLSTLLKPDMGRIDWAACTKYR